MGLRISRDLSSRDAHQWNLLLELFYRTIDETRAARSLGATPGLTRPVEIVLDIDQPQGVQPGLGLKPDRWKRDEKGIKGLKNAEEKTDQESNSANSKQLDLLAIISSTHHCAEAKQVVNPERCTVPKMTCMPASG